MISSKQNKRVCVCLWESMVKFIWYNLKRQMQEEFLFHCNATDNDSEKVNDAGLRWTDIQTETAITITL